MIAVPAIDLREGCCVQLVGGAFEDERVRLPNPVDAARRWADAGFTRLHVVDLDAAMGTGSNDVAIERLAAFALANSLDIQLGGGIRDDAAIERALARGVSRVVVGTRAVTDREWLIAAATRWPTRIAVAADARDGVVVVNGWTKTLGVSVAALLGELNALPLAGVLLTCVDREGLLGGPDVVRVQAAAAATRHPLIASGGIATMDDLAALERAGASAAVIGMALYTGALDPRAVAREFSA